MKSDVDAALQMCAHVRLNAREIKELAVAGRRERQSFIEHRPQRTAKPVVGRDVKPGLLSLQDFRAEFASHEISQDQFLTRTPYLQVRRKRTGKFDDSVIEKRRPHFD